MARRRLSADEEALWAALTRTVRPLRPAARAGSRPTPPVEDPAPVPVRKAVAAMPPHGVAPPPVPPPARAPAAMLDSGWEKRIRSGALAPDVSIDLHGHTLSAAHARLNHAIAAALAQGARVMLVVTGKPRARASADGASRRGAIRAEISHWLDTSPHADRIASVRVAHPRHGGDGALYIILRRRR